MSGAARRTGRLSLAQVFAAPLLLAVVTVVGLVSALVEDGPADALSWATLGALVAVIAWYWWRPAPARR